MPGMRCAPVEPVEKGALLPRLVGVRLIKLVSAKGGHARFNAPRPCAARITSQDISDLQSAQNAQNGLKDTRGNEHE